MSGLIETETVMVNPPEEGKVWRFTSEATAKTYVTPAAWLGKYITWESAVAGEVVFGADVNVAVTADTGSTRGGAGSAGDPYTLTVNDASGWDYAADTPTSWYVPRHHTHFSVVGAGAVQVKEG